MKFVIVDQTATDMFNEEFETREEAINAATKEWNHMSAHDQKLREAYYVLESQNPDEDAEDHFDGDIIWGASIWYAVLKDEQDDDWGTGSFDRAEAIKMMQEYEDGMIAVIDLHGNVCVEEIRKEDI